MRIVQLTPGTGGMFCGSCLRDNALVAELRRQGHDVLLAPLYLPLQTDEPDQSAGTPLFFGGINVFLQQKSALFRNTPRAMDRLLDAPRLLKWASGLVAKTNAEELGELTLSMLRGEEGRQAKELERLMAWLQATGKPDVVILSNALLAGLARRIKLELKAPIVCTLHGEDSFLDALPEPHRGACWAALQERARDIDAFIAVSRYYAEVLGPRMKVPSPRLHVVYNGIALDGYAPASAPPQPPVLGYFARLCPMKGLDTLVEAFVQLKARDRVKGLRLCLGGTVTPGDEAFLVKIKAHLRAHHLLESVEFFANVDRKTKQDFFRSLSVLSVPATYGEAFGLYLLEAWASGVPVVQPRHGAFPELLEATGGGVLCEPGDPAALADALEALLLNPEQRCELGARGRQAVLKDFSVERMALNMLEKLEKIRQGPK